METMGFVISKKRDKLVLLYKEITQANMDFLVSWLGNMQNRRSIDIAFKVHKYSADNNQMAPRDLEDMQQVGSKTGRSLGQMSLQLFYAKYYHIDVIKKGGYDRICMRFSPTSSAKQKTVLLLIYLAVSTYELQHSYGARLSAGP
uniref:Uncharacterized protein n=1 Tax=Solanum lycopersicum TaxID=4081 RepID=A0A3Q7ER91_SOLLC